MLLHAKICKKILFIQIKMYFFIYKKIPSGLSQFSKKSYQKRNSKIHDKTMKNGNHYKLFA